jgi:DNA-binding MarR family transcriptional regulator
LQGGGIVKLLVYLPCESKMVKPLDDTPELLDHVGWRLWRAAAAWKAEFDQGMVELGHAWFTEARANLLAHLDREGTPQSLLVTRMNVSKQAVQQFVDELVADGIVERRANPDDGRSKIIAFTRRGRRVLDDANRVKRRIQRRYGVVLGEARFASLMDCLETLNSGG